MGKLMKEIIVFFIGEGEYGVEIAGMKSLENFMGITPLPDVPEYILGTVKIRDDIYPVYDLKAKLAVPVTQTAEEPKVLVLQTKAGSLACVVDNVSKVFRAEGENIQQFPGMARTEATKYIDFVVRKDNELIVVINPQELLTEEEVEEIRKIDFSKTEEQATEEEETSKEESGKEEIEG